MKPTPFPHLLHAFFHDWLVQQRNVSHHTVLSYRDSWRLFLRFVAAEKKKSVAKLDLSDLSAVEVLAFLEDIEQVRKSSIGTRNSRLGALHSFFSFVADREPLLAAHCAAVLRSRSNKHLNRKSVIWTRTRLPPFSPNRIAPSSKANVITCCWQFFSTPVPASKRLWTSLLKQFVWNRRSKFDYSAKGERNESARYGPKQWTYCRPF